MRKGIINYCVCDDDKKEVDDKNIDTACRAGCAGEHYTTTLGFCDVK